MAQNDQSAEQDTEYQNVKGNLDFELGQNRPVKGHTENGDKEEQDHLYCHLH